MVSSRGGLLVHCKCNKWLTSLTSLSYFRSFPFLGVPSCSFRCSIDVFVRRGQPREVASLYCAFMAFGFAPLGHQQVELAGTGWNLGMCHDMPMTCPWHAHDFLNSDLLHNPNAVSCSFILTNSINAKECQWSLKLVKLDRLPGHPFFNLWVKLGSCASTVVIDPSGTSKYASVLLSCQQFQTVPTLGLRKTTSQKWRVHLSQRHRRSLFRCLFRRARNARWSPPMAFSFGWTMRLVPTTQAAACAPVVRASEFPAHPSLASTRISQIQVARYGKIWQNTEYRWV